MYTMSWHKTQLISCHDTLCQITSYERATIFTARFPILFQVMGQNLILPCSDSTGKLSAAHPSPIRKTGYTGGPHTSSSRNTFKVFVDRFWPLSNGFHRWDSNPRKSSLCCVCSSPFSSLPQPPDAPGGIPYCTAAAPSGPYARTVSQNHDPFGDPIISPQVQNIISKKLRGSCLFRAGCRNIPPKP